MTGPLHPGPSSCARARRHGGAHLVTFARAAPPAAWDAARARSTHGQHNATRSLPSLGRPRQARRVRRPARPLPRARPRRACAATSRAAAAWSALRTAACQRATRRRVGPEQRGRWTGGAGRATSGRAVTTKKIATRSPRRAAVASLQFWPSPHAACCACHSVQSIEYLRSFVKSPTSYARPRAAPPPPARCQRARAHAGSPLRRAPPQCRMRRQRRAAAQLARGARAAAGGTGRRVASRRRAQPAARVCECAGVCPPVFVCSVAPHARRRYSHPAVSAARRPASARAACGHAARCARS
jgi:hypothetical protein